MTLRRTRTYRVFEFLVHVLTWGYIFISPIFFRSGAETVDWSQFVHGCIFPLCTCVLFYVNYFWLIPHFLLEEKRIKLYAGVNVLLCVLLEIVMELHAYLVMPIGPIGVPNFESGKDMRDFPPRILFVIQGIFNFVFVVGVCVALRLSLKWRESERALSEAELRQSQAELKNLKNQINPHFLLNTLNNIYALTAFDSEKAQKAILELSRLLRYMLYENQTDRVYLMKEVEFIEAYVALMNLRLSGEVDVSFSRQIEDESAQVAPLIFISLVENAFKHGVSPTRPSFIHICIQADSRAIYFSCKNSNFPKTPDDKSPGGIGLSQVRRRLELAYPNSYTWRSGTQEDEKVYYSEISIKV